MPPYEFFFGGMRPLTDKPICKLDAKPYSNCISNHKVIALTKVVIPGIKVHEKM